ncbi:MAG TPA: FMN-binding protein [Spirochaetia bacterium]|nr:FMN-binding protein [Spirochaetia bacterium]
MKSSSRKVILAAAAASALGMAASAAVGGQAKNVALTSGTFTGKREYAYYGWVKVQAVVRNGTVTDVKVLEYPNDNGRSRYISSVAIPYLVQETVGGQSWKVDLVSGATFTSTAYEKSLQEALQQAGL